MEIRPAHTDEELELLVDIRNRVRPDDPINLDDVHSAAAQSKEIIHLLAWDDGRAVGAAAVWLPHQRDCAGTLVWVPADERRRGLGSALYHALSTWAAERGQQELETWVEEADPDGLAFAQRRGFAEQGREMHLALDLAAIEAPLVEPPEGIEITTWAERPDLVQGLYEVACVAYRDIPGEEESEMESFENWLAHDMQSEGDHPWATFVALAGDEVVGYSKFSLTKAQPKVAHHDLTGVKRAWRGRGIARALKQAQIAWAKKAGYERLATRNEERNEPIKRLNDEFGYRPWSARVLMRGPVASGGS